MNITRLPIFRSESQVAILSHLFLVARTPLTLTEIASQTGVSLAGVHKEIERLERAHLVRSTRHGRNRLVAIDHSSVFAEDLRSLLLKAYGPPARLREALAGLPGIQSAFIHGSWATESPAPGDIDLMVIGSPDPSAVYSGVRQAESQLGLPIGVTLLSVDEWQDGDSGFLKNVRRSPKVQVL